MSQNRQSEEDRKLADKDHDVNLRAGQNIELLYAKLDALQEQLAQEQQPIELPMNVLPLHQAQKIAKFSNEASEQEASKLVAAK